MQQFRNKAVTLIELIMVITIVGILTTVSSMYIKGTIDLWRFLTFRNEVVSQGRVALFRIEREIRQIRDTSSIITAGAAQFSFTDINGANISFSLSGNNLMRDADILASGVSTLAFIYYDQANALIPYADILVAPNQTNIYRINISFNIQSGTQSKTLRTQVYPRNL